MTLLRRAMGYLGLGPDDEFDDTDDGYDERPTRRAAQPEPMDGGSVRPVPNRPARAGREGTRREPERVERFDQTDTETVRPRAASSPSSAVRTVSTPANSKPHAVSPRSFDDAQQVGDRFRDGQAVILNLQDVNRDLSRRLIDFTAGLCYGLGGQMSRVAKDVYLLTPANQDAANIDVRG
jgi:cell division inhibitor SepF